MKKSTLLLIAFVIVSRFAQAQQVQSADSVTIPWEQQVATIFQNVNLIAVTSHHLIDRSFQLCPIENFDGTNPNTSNAIDYSIWQQVYGTPPAGRDL